AVGCRSSAQTWATSPPAGPRRACSSRRASGASPTGAARSRSRSSWIRGSARPAWRASSRTPCAPCVWSRGPRSRPGPSASSASTEALDPRARSGSARVAGALRPPVALTSAASHHMPGVHYRFDLHLLVVARATALRIGALDARDPRREALGLFERALELEEPLRADAMRDVLGVALHSERSLALTALRTGALVGRDAGERQRVRDLVAGDIVHDEALAAATRHLLLALVLDE